MKCELCHNNEAAEVLHRNENGLDREYYVCPACAAREKNAIKAAARKKRDKSRPNMSLTIHAIGAPVPPPVLDALLGATANFMGSLENAAMGDPSDLKCKVCGRSWGTFRDTGLLGCPACYHAFKELLEPRFKAMQPGLKHTGRTPQAAYAGDMREALEKRLEKAVREQNFEEAGRLRDELAKLGGKPGSRK